MVLTIEGHKSVVMGHGQTQQEALDDLFNMTLVLYVQGYNFKHYFE